MVRGHIKSKIHIFKIDDAYIAELLLDPEDDKEVDCLLRILHGLTYVIELLQDPNVLLSAAQVVFNGVIDKYSAPQLRLETRAFVNDKTSFQNAIRRMQNGEEQSLAALEKSSVQHWLSGSAFVCEESKLQKGSFAG